ncbi:MAG: MotA/TolQ/ExbB proton channel family protein [Oligoflexales bacterium]
MYLRLLTHTIRVGSPVKLMLPWLLFTEAMFAQTETSPLPQEVAISSPTLIQRMFEAGPVVSLVLFILVTMSVLTWAIFFAKWLYLRRIEVNCKDFTKSFWDSRSLNDLNGRLSEHPYSPLREVFRNGYAELVRGSQMKESAVTSDIAINAAVDNLTRTLHKSKQYEKRQLERYLPVLAISASACPFIGLFGTVWGIMTAFEGIARTGSSSLAAVAPGISEALIATAFGLAAAIPAVVGYNIAANKIRGMMSHMDGFGFDFLNIVERYLVSDRSKPQGGGASEQAPRI